MTHIHVTNDACYNIFYLSTKQVKCNCIRHNKNLNILIESDRVENDWLIYPGNWIFILNSSIPNTL